MTPWRWAIMAAAGLAALIGAFFFGRDVGIDAIKAEQLDAIEASADREKAKQRRIDALSRAAAARETARETIVREIYRDVPTIVEKPVYRTRCIDDDGVRLIERAVAAANGEGRPEAAGAAAGIPDAGGDDKP